MRLLLTAFLALALLSACDTQPSHTVSYEALLTACKTDAIRRFGNPDAPPPPWYAETACRCVFDETRWNAAPADDRAATIDYLANGKFTTTEDNERTKALGIGLAFWPSQLAKGTPGGECLQAEVDSKVNP